jgi:cytochrome c
MNGSLMKVKWQSVQNEGAIMIRNCPNSHRAKHAYRINGLFRQLNSKMQRSVNSSPRPKDSRNAQNMYDYVSIAFNAKCKAIRQ